MEKSIQALNVYYYSGIWLRWSLCKAATSLNGQPPWSPNSANIALKHCSLPLWCNHLSKTAIKSGPQVLCTSCRSMYSNQYSNFVISCHDCATHNAMTHTCLEISLIIASLVSFSQLRCIGVLSPPTPTPAHRRPNPICMCPSFSMILVQWTHVHVCVRGQGCQWTHAAETDLCLVSSYQFSLWSSG